MKSVSGIDLDELRPTGNDDSIIGALSEDDINDLKNAATDLNQYKLEDKNCSIFSPQIEVFEPFAAHVDASRSNMSAKQLLQCVVTEKCDLPYILNKNYKSLTDANSAFVERAPDDGIVLHSVENIIIVYFKNLKKIESFYVPFSKKLVNNCLNIIYKIGQTDNKKTFKKGELIFDYTNQTEAGVPKIGYRTNVMYGSLYGYTAEDAFVMSESASKRFTINRTKKLLIPISIEIKYLKKENNKYFYDEGEITGENYAQYLKVDYSESMLSEFNNTSDDVSKIYGKSVDSFDGGTVKKIKVHKISKDNLSDIQKKYIYTSTIINEIQGFAKRQLKLKSDMFFNLNANMPEELAISISNDIFSQYETSTTLSKTMLENIALDYNVSVESIDLVLEVEVCITEHTRVGDKFANMYAGKGVCSLILPDHLMPKDEHGNTVDIIFNPLGLFGRNNWGTIFELGFSKIVEDIQMYVIGKDPTEASNRILYVAEHFMKETDLEYYDKIISLVDSFKDLSNWELFVQDVLHKGLYFFVGNFPNITYSRFSKEFLSGYEDKFDMNIQKKVETVYPKELMEYLREGDFVSNIFDSEIIEDVPQMVYFGKNYWVKLYHTADSKYNSIAFADTHSKSTGEAPKGRANKGGCRISWQSTSALMGHKENNYMLKELNTIKSSASASEKNNFFRKMLADGQYALKDKYTATVMTTLNNSLHMLGMKFEHINYHRGVEFYDDPENHVEFEEDDLVVDLNVTNIENYQRKENLHVCLDDNVDNEDDYVPEHDPITGEIISKER